MLVFEICFLTRNPGAVQARIAVAIVLSFHILLELKLVKRRDAYLCTVLLVAES